MGAQPGAARPHPQPQPQTGEPAAAIVAQGLVRRFGGVRALEGVDLEAPAGTLLVVLGPNGAGKSTLLGILAGLTRPDAGQVRVAGQDLARAPAAARQQVGLVSHQPLVYPELTAEENLRFHARLYGLPSGPEAVLPALEAVDLVRQRHRRARDFSRGMRQRLAIARATLHAPAVLLLDEPFTGLDPTAADRLAALLTSLAQGGHALLVTTHDLERARALAHRLVILDRGRVVWAGSAADPAAADLAALYRRLTGAEPAPGAATVAAPRISPEAAPRGRPGPDPVGSAPAPPGLVSAALTLAWKDLRVELRAREILPPVLVFALLATVIFQFALPREPSGQVVGAAGALWIALLLGSTLGLSRAMGSELDSGGMTGLLMAPVDRGALFVGKWLAGYALGLLVALGLLPAGVVWLGIPIDRLPALTLVVALGLVGWVAAGTLLAAMAVGTRAREVLLPVLLFPVVLPLIIPCVQVTAALLNPPPVAGPSPVLPLALVLAFDVIFLVLGFLLLPFVVEA